MSAVQVGNYFYEPTIQNKLGSGSFATVYRGFSHGRKETVAVKVIDYDTRSDFEKRYLTQEVRLMKGIAHPNILMLRDSKVRTLLLNSFSHFRKLGTRSFWCWR